MRAVLLSLFLLSWGPQTTSESTCFHRWKLEPESRVVVSGYSNVNEFSCMASYPAHRQFLTETCSGDLSIFKGGIRLKVQGFECGNELMNRDFSKTLKQDEFPDITLTLIDLKGENTGVGLSVLMGEVDVEIAGVNHRMQMRCTLESLSDGRKRILGSQPLSFSDFGIVPPRRLLGMVRVENEINVDFTLILKEVF